MRESKQIKKDLDQEYKEWAMLMAEAKQLGITVEDLRALIAKEKEGRG